MISAPFFRLSIIAVPLAASASAQVYAIALHSTELDVLHITGHPHPEEQVTASELDQNIRSVHRIDLETINQPASRIEDLTYLIPGAQPGVQDSGFSTSLILRGFQPGARQSVHGFTGLRPEFNGLPDIQRLFTRDLFTVEALEVLAGPDAISQGLTNPGGSLRYLGKQPQFSQNTYLGIQANADAPYYENNGTRLYVDTTGPLNNEVAYRLVAVNQNQQIQPNDFSSQRGHLLGGLTWRYSPNGSLRLESEYQENRQPYLFGTIILNEQPVYGHYYTSPEQDSKRQYYRNAVYWSQSLQLNNEQTLKLDARYAYAKVDRHEELIGFAEQNLADDAKYLIGYHTQLEDDYEQHSWRLKLNWQLNAEEHQHQFFLFADQHRENFNFNRLWASFDFKIDIAEQTFIPLDRANGQPVSLDNRNGFSWLDQNANTTSGYAAAYQIDTFLAGRQVSAATGVRYSQFENKMLRWQFQDAWTSQSNLPTTIDSSSLSWQWGARAELSAPFYAHISQSFAGFPQESDLVDQRGELLDPEKIAMSEVGIHYIDGYSQQASLTAYHLKRSDLAKRDTRYDADDWAQLGYAPHRLAGSQSNLGFEGSYALTANSWHLNLNGSYIAEFKDSNKDSKNNKWPGVAQLTAGGRLAYTQQTSNSTSWQPWIAGHYLGKRYADTHNEISVPARYRLDTGLSISHRKQQLSISVTNIFDQEYVNYLSSVSNVYQGDRRRIWISAATSF